MADKDYKARFRRDEQNNGWVWEVYRYTGMQVMDGNGGLVSETEAIFHNWTQDPNLRDEQITAALRNARRGLREWHEFDEKLTRQETD